MAKFGLLVLAMGLAVLPADIVAPSPVCTPLEVSSGTCEVPPAPDDPSITLWGTETVGGSGGNANNGGDDAGDEVGGAGPSSRCTPATPQINRCPRLEDGPDPSPEVGKPAVTLRDIATFRPTASVSHSQPNGWTIAGLDTNFYATGSQHVVDGVLLGQPASVRFTPVAWNWTYGDGHSATRDVPGAPWPSLADEFNPTPTSHIYRERATFTITLTVDYAAEYRYAGGPWVPIAGTLRVPANDLTLTVGSAKTVLVEQNCNQNPRGPGC